MYGLTQGTPVNVQAKVQARKSGAATPSTDLLLNRSISAPHNPSASDVAKLACYGKRENCSDRIV